MMLVTLLVTASAVSCSGSQTPTATDGPPDSEVVLPDGVEFNTEANGPLSAEESSSPDYDLSLYSTGSEGGRLAVMRGGPQTDTRPGALPVENAGPGGLGGCSGQIGDRSVLVLSRDRTPEELCADIDKVTPDGTPAIEGAKSLASFEHSPVPGIGSVPLPVDGSFTVRSYTSTGADVQRSVVVASFKVEDTITEVFDWWFDNGAPSEFVQGATRYEMPAYAEIDQDPVASPDVPTATLTVHQRDDGTVVLVRITALSSREERRVLESIHWT